MKKRLYTVLVGNIGNVDCETRKSANQTFEEYRDQSRNNYGRAAGETVQMLVDGELVRDFDPSLLVARPGTFKRWAWDLIETFDDEAIFQLIGYQLIRGAPGLHNPLGFWEVNDTFVLCSGLDKEGCLEAMEERWVIFKHRYLYSALVKELADVGTQDNNPVIEAGGVPFLDIRVTTPETEP
jgi:hypothetical protein